MFGDSKMKVNVEYQRPAATAAQVSALESALTIKFPENSAEILHTFSGARFADNMHCSRGHVSILKFCSLTAGDDSTQQTFEQYRDRIPKGFIPVAIAEGGNLLLVSLDMGSVFFWDHELEDYDESSDGSEACIKLADNLDEFLEDLKSNDNASSHAKVVSVKIDPAFAAKFEL